MRLSKVSGRTTVLVALVILTTPFLLAQNTRYRLIDIGTLGGPTAYGPMIGPGSQLLNNSGTVAGTADTSEQNPDCGCFVFLGLRWQDGVLTSLEALPGGEFSLANAINARGWITGASDTGDLDPVTGGPIVHAVLWNERGVLDLGTLETGLLSAAWYVKDSGQVVGNATVDTTADPFSDNGIGPFGSPTHVFTWKNGSMRDLGTLGGPDSFAAPGCNNQRDELVAGSSFVDSIPNPDTGLPTLEPVLWNDGTMTDLGTLGGTYGYSQCTNSRGQVIGQSSVTSEECFGQEPGSPGCHAFVWNGSALKDLGTLGGSSSSAFWLNENGEAVGGSLTPNDEAFHATLWSNGATTDLGTLPGDCGSNAWAINSRGQIVGNSFNCETGVAEVVMWDKGSIIDLNVSAFEPLNINDRGEITGVAVPPGCSDGDGCPARAFLLVPCHDGDQGCDHGTTAVQPHFATASAVRWRSHWARRTRVSTAVERLVEH